MSVLLFMYTIKLGKFTIVRNMIVDETNYLKGCKSDSGKSNILKPSIKVNSEIKLWDEVNKPVIEMDIGNESLFQNNKSEIKKEFEPGRSDRIKQLPPISYGERDIQYDLVCAQSLLLWSKTGNKVLVWNIWRSLIEKDFRNSSVNCCTLTDKANISRNIICSTLCKGFCDW